MLTLGHDRGVLPLGRPMPRTVYVLALASAFCSACATIFIRQGLRGRGPYTGFWINLVVGTVGLWAAVLLTGGFGRLSATGIAFFVLAGLIGTVAGRLLRFVSIEKVGASIAAALINLHPLFATGVAILLLGERVTAPILAGTVVIVLGTILLSIGGRRGGIRPWQITLPLLSAACFGVVAVLRKLAWPKREPSSARRSTSPPPWSRSPRSCSRPATGKPWRVAAEASSTSWRRAPRRTAPCS